jgi:hypothetical protein
MIPGRDQEAAGVPGGQRVPVSATLPGPAGRPTWEVRPAAAAARAAAAGLADWSSGMRA